MRDYTEKTILYYDKIASDYIVSDAAVVINDKIDKLIGLLPGKKVIDIACGPGHDTNYLTLNGYDCLGIDLSSKMIELAKKYNNGKFEIKDFLNFEALNESYDGIWCSSALVHTKNEDLPGLLNRFWNVLNINGVLGIITAHKQARQIDLNDTREYIMYDIEELKSYLIASKFNIADSEIFSYGNKDRIFILAKK